MDNFFAGLYQTKFLGEPAWRWVLFVGAMLGLIAAWGGVLRIMKQG